MIASANGILPSLTTVAPIDSLHDYSSVKVIGAATSNFRDWFKLNRNVGTTWQVYPAAGGLGVTLTKPDGLEHKLLNDGTTITLLVELGIQGGASQLHLNVHA